ncbi:phosphoribosyltransferase [Taibaiella soli]|nr:phosphoribosyltransferase [Taibaiella soli]
MPLIFLLIPTVFLQPASNDGSAALFILVLFALMFWYIVRGRRRSVDGSKKSDNFQQSRKAEPDKYGTGSASTAANKSESDIQLLKDNSQKQKKLNSDDAFWDNPLVKPAVKRNVQFSYLTIAAFKEKLGIASFDVVRNPNTGKLFVSTSKGYYRCQRDIDLTNPANLKFLIVNGDFNECCLVNVDDTGKNRQSMRSVELEEQPDYFQLLKDNPQWQDQLNLEHTHLDNIIEKSFEVPAAEVAKNRTDEVPVPADEHIFPKDLTKKKWCLITPSVGSVDVEFKENGNFYFFAELTGNTWRIVDDKLFLDFDGIGIGIGHVFNLDRIGGFIFGKKGRPEHFQLKKKSCDELERTSTIPENSQGTNSTNLEFEFVGTKWKIRNHDVDIRDGILEFLPDGVLKYGNILKSGWSFAAGILALTVNSGYCAYLGVLKNESVITGTAKNIKGETWKFDIEKIISEKDPLPTIGSASQTRVETSVLSAFAVESNSAHGYNWRALWHYYPVNKFHYASLGSSDLENRNHVFKFKDGEAPGMYATKMSKALLSTYGKDYLKTKTLLIVPASSKDKTERRFKLFCSKLCELTGLINGYEILTNNDKEKKPKHLGGDGGIIPYVKLTESISGRKILVIDDVRTSGRSSNDIYNLLKSNGASEIEFIYFARTVSTL